MANSKSALKRVRQTKTATQRNRLLKNRVKEARKSIFAAVEAGDNAAAQEAYVTLASAADKAAKKGAFHKKRADRYKARAAASIAKASA